MQILIELKMRILGKISDLQCPQSFDPVSDNVIFKNSRKYDNNAV